MRALWTRTNSQRGESSKNSPPKLGGVPFAFFANGGVVPLASGVLRDVWFTTWHHLQPAETNCAKT